MRMGAGSEVMTIVKLSVVGMTIVKPSMVGMKAIGKTT